MPRLRRPRADARATTHAGAALTSARGRAVGLERARGDRHHGAHPFRGRSLGLPATFAERRAGGAARPTAQRHRRAAGADRHRRRHARGPQQRLSRLREDAANERPVRCRAQRRQLGVRSDRQVPVRAPLPAEPRGRRAAIHGRRPARRDRRRDVAPRHAGRGRDQIGDPARPDRRDRAHGRKHAADTGTEERRRCLVLAHDTARGPDRDDACRRR